MDYKEKYEKALGRAKTFSQRWQGIEATDSELALKELKEIFPELKESEDERMVKFIKNQLFNIKKTITENYELDAKLTNAIDWLEKQGEQKTADKKYTFNAIPRLLDMIQPTDRAKAYCQKLIDSLIQEGYGADAKIVGEYLKQMNGEKVAMATMDEQKPSENKGMNLVEEEMTPFQKKVFFIIDTAIEEEQGLKQVCDELLSLAHDEIMQKPAWSDEDERMLTLCASSVQTRYNDGLLTNEEYKQASLWLKSLKPQSHWKPSDEQLRPLGYAIDYFKKKKNDTTYLESLYNDLINL